MTITYSDQTTTSFCLFITFEGLHDLIPESRVYALSPDGQILATQKVNGGMAQFTLPLKDLQGITMAIGPASAELQTAPLELGNRTWYPLFNTSWQFEPGTINYSLPSVPENMWRWWLVRSMYVDLKPEPQRQRRFLMF